MTPVAGSAAARASCSLRRVGSIIGCARPWVSASSPKSTMVWPSTSRSGRRQREVVGQRDVAADRAEGRGRHQHRLVAERAADEQPAQQAVRSRGRCRRRRGPATPAGCDRAAPAPPRRPRSGRAGRGRAAPSSTGVPSAAASARECRARPRRPGGLDTTTIRSTSGSASSRRSASRVASPPTADDRSRPPTPSACDADPRRPAWSSRREQLLAAGAGRGDDADRPGRTALAKPSPTPPTTAVPQSGPSPAAPREAAYVLERDLLGSPARCR